MLDNSGFLRVESSDLKFTQWGFSSMVFPIHKQITYVKFIFRCI